MQSNRSEAGLNKKIMRLLALSISAIGFFAISLPSEGQTTEKHSLDDLIAIAIKSNPEILAARDQAKAVGGQLSAARALYT